jgi:predicted permease
LLASPGFAVVAFLTLSLGIGANAAIFTIINKALLKPLPIEAPARVAGLSNTARNGRLFPTFSWLNYKDLRQRSAAAADLFAYAPMPASLSHDGTNERIWGYLVSGNYFEALGLKPRIGRLISAADDMRPGAHPVTVISDEAWRRRFASDSTVVGRDVLVNGRRFTIIGVAPAGFVGLEVAFTAEMWFPIMMESEISPRSRWQDRRNFENLYVAMRLKPDVSPTAARAAVRSAAEELAQEYPADNQGRSIEISPVGLFGTMGRGVTMGVSAVTLAVVGLVLLLVCANLINLTLARSAERQREIAVRQALGATRGHIARQLMAESLLLALAGGSGGLLLARLFTIAASRFRLPVDIPLSYDFQIDWRVVAFTAAVSLAAGIAFGLIPAWQCSSVSALSPVARRSRLRSFLVGSQVCVSFALMMCAGLTLRSLQRAEFADAGMNPQNAVEIGFDLDLQGYSRERRNQFTRDLLDRVRALPAMESAGIGSAVPPDPHISSSVFRVEGAAASERGTSPRSITIAASPGYRAALGMSLRYGREFSDADNETAPAVALVNETLARRFWGGADAVGQRFALGDSGTAWIEIVGIVGDGKYRSLGEEPTALIMFPMLQSNAGLLKLVARSADSRNGVEALRRTIESIDPNLPVFDGQTLSEHMRLPLFPARIAAVMFGSFGSLALLLAGVGVFGVVSFTAHRRLQEIGIRMALGACRGNVVSLIVRQGMTPIVVGMAAGFGATLLLTPLIQMRVVLYGVSERDPATFAAIAIVLAVVGLLACYIPARRASAVDPVRALRQE